MLTDDILALPNKFERITNFMIKQHENCFQEKKRKTEVDWVITCYAFSSRMISHVLFLLHS